MGWTAAIGPALGIVRSLAGASNKQNMMQGTGGEASPFDAVFNPPIDAWNPERDFPVPQRNPRFEQAELQSVFDETPGLMMSALTGGDTEGAMIDAPAGPEVLPRDGPKPQRIDMAELAREQNKPVRIDLSSMPRPKTTAQLAADQGYTVNPVMGREVAPGSQPSAFAFEPEENITDMPRLPAGGGETTMPKSAFDEDVPAPVPAPAAPSAFEPQFDTSAEEEEEGPFDSFGGGVNYVQDWLEGSPENPLFQTGMALMASGYDGSNPFTGMQAGLNAIPQLAMQREAQALARRKGEAEIADAGRQQQLQEALAMIASMYGEPNGEGPSSQRSKGQATLVR